MMRATALLLAMLLSLTACGGNGDSSPAVSDAESGTNAPDNTEPSETQVQAGTEVGSLVEQTEESLPEPVSLPAAGEIVKSGSWGENITYTLDSNGILTISGTGKVSRLEGETYPEDSEILYLVVEEGVTEIVGASGFSENPNLRYVSLPSTVKVIKDSAFSYCAGLTTVILSEGTTEIEGYAFYGCKSLTSITLPDSCKRLGLLAFGGSGLQSIDLPEGMNYIDNSFSYSELKTIRWPTDVTTIYSGTFGSCAQLTSVTLPNTVTSIRDGAFVDCESLTDVYYQGTEDEFAGIEIGGSNDALLNATIHYNAE